MLANSTFRKSKRASRHSIFLLVSAVSLLALIVLLICVWLVMQSVAGYYAHRIYPNVYVAGLKLGQMTRQEATDLLKQADWDTETTMLTLHDPAAPSDGVASDAGHWSFPWSQAGLELDVPATVQAAFAVGHADQQRLRDQARTWLGRHDIPPVFSVNPDQARQVLQELALSVSLPPTDATLRLEGDQVVVVPGQPGRELDVEATLARLVDLPTGSTRGAAPQGAEVALVLRSIPPRVTDVSSVQAQVEDMLERRVDLSAYDVVTDQTFRWTLERTDLITWLRIIPGPDGPQVEVEAEAAQTTLESLTKEMDQGHGFRLAEATQQVLSTFKDGGGEVALYLTHAPHRYAVRAGDTLSSIANRFGMPSWRLVQANSGINVDWLQVGQELTIPSQDLLTPHLPVPGKRVVVDIAEQRMRVYQDGALIYDWLISTGIDESPTHTGIFQVLNKEENAYASLWDLWMPHFVGIYAAGPDFYNGFHGLPTLSSGRRLWEGLLGSPASYGCIILGLKEAEIFYQWAEVGVIVVIK
jgi:LysM repeat protein